MFRLISIIGFGAVLVGIGLHYMALRRRSSDVLWAGFRTCCMGILRGLTFLLTLLLLQQRLRALGIFKKLIFLLGLLCFVVLVVTGFYPPVVLGSRLSGYLRMVHVTAGGVFAVCVAILAVAWAHQHRFDRSDWQPAGGGLRIIRPSAANEGPGSLGPGPERPDLGRKICFWLIILLALPVILSIVLSMFRLFGTDIQEFLFHLHRYSSLLLALVGIVYIYLTTLAHKRAV